MADTREQTFEARPSEEACGVGIDRGGVSEIRGHCVNDWNAVVKVERSGDKYWRVTCDDSGAQVLLDNGRLRSLGYALIEATND